MDDFIILFLEWGGFINRHMDYGYGKLFIIFLMFVSGTRFEMEINSDALVFVRFPKRKSLE